jgi:hypothetical protein
MFYSCIDMDGQTLWSKIKDAWQFIFSSLGLPWVNIFKNLSSVLNLIQARFHPGLYEVLDYEASLELKDHNGKVASVQKYEKVRYLQNNISTFQDQAWGDGKFLINYHCSPGNPVDIYRSGYKTYVLISLRQVRNRDEIDEFRFTWDIRQGFLQPTGFWASEISHFTERIKMNVVFPRSRPPLRATVFAKNSQRTFALGKDSILHLPDGKWEVVWERLKPKLYEQYILSWQW